MLQNEGCKFVNRFLQSNNACLTPGTSSTQTTLAVDQLHFPTLNIYSSRLKTNDSSEVCSNSDQTIIENNNNCQHLSKFLLI